MGAGCCKEGAAAEQLLNSENLSHNLVREQERDFHDIYEVVEVIGEGSISRISKIKKKDVGGSSRLSVVIRRNAKKQGKQVETQSNYGRYPTVYCALKEIDLSMVKREYIEELNNEINLLKGLVSYMQTGRLRCISF
jgi:hypothetical protein